MDNMIKFLMNLGEDVTPVEICKSLSLIGRLFNAKSILEPNAGFGEILYYCDYGDSHDAYSVNNEYLKSGMDITNRVNFINKRFLDDDITKKYDLVISQLPFSYGAEPGENTEIFLDIEYICKILSLLNRGGAMVCVVPSRFLSEAYSKNLREEILWRYSVEMVIEIPYDLYKVNYHNVSIIVIKNAMQRDKALVTKYEYGIESILYDYLNETGQCWIDKELLSERWDRHYHSDEFNWLNFYKPSVFKTIGEMAEVLHGPMLQKKDKGDIVVYNSDNYIDGMLILTDDDKYIEKGNISCISNYILLKDDIVVRFHMDSSNNISTYNENFPDAIIDFKYILIRPADDFLKEFISTSSGKSFIESQFKRLMKGGKKGVSAEDIKGVKIPVLEDDDLDIIKKVNSDNLDQNELIERIKNIRGELDKLRSIREEKKQEILRLENEKLRKNCEKSYNMIEIMANEIKELKCKIDYLEDKAAFRENVLDALMEIKNRSQETAALVKKHDKILHGIDDDVKVTRVMVENIYNMMQDIHKIQDNILSKLDNLKDEGDKEAVYKRLVDDIWKLVEDKYEHQVKGKLDELMNKYIEKFSSNGWEKLESDTRNFLITSKVVYYDLKQYDVIDFSPCCIALTKALEREMYKKVFCNMKNFYKSKNYDKRYLPDGLIYHNNGLYNYNFDDKFTLGSVPYLLCVKFSKDRPNGDFIRNKKREALKDFYTEVLFDKNGFENDADIERYIENFANKVDEITEKYRNQSAHKDKLIRTKAEECYSKLIETERLLVEFINKTM